ncbi:hypothetical protein HYE54_10915 [Aggregatibacter actinomycetemcomitans]|uniref:hypothetical protein n=1 Tax=Aggregatibacter actinomycetemcomitans TaxID=714 RepID=UPI00197B3065|nr:hypothetical protein [Aggregatibacter actinomycetemcomitans]MBN6069221.1 hypothetical protein [Aggregatibacter actinomycetemcomitans]MBN6086518.1 hypothetical protein [Aggregatibacter actinomycetemcomitans]
MAEQQKMKDLAYSIRKRGDDEIEIRDSIFDGYARGFIRFVLFAGVLIIGLGGGNSLTEPFASQITDFKVTFTRAYHPDERIMPNYKTYLKLYNTPGTLTSKSEFTTYEEYRKPYLDDWKYEKVRIYLYGVFFVFILFFFFLPRARGFRVNRKKRVIYWQTILGSHSIAFVPEKGDPLGGINYSRFGLYAFGEHERFSLQLWINDYFTKRRATACFGVYPSPSSEHNAQILRAIRAYLTEDNPEFLNYVGRDYKNFGLKFNIALCNAFALRVPFSRKKADAAIEKALAVWNKKSPHQKQGWFNDIHGYQEIINENHKREELDNEVK